MLGDLIEISMHEVVDNILSPAKSRWKLPHCKNLYNMLTAELSL